MGKSLEELEKFVVAFDEPKYRATQIQNKIISGVKTIDEITSVN